MKIHSFIYSFVDSFIYWDQFYEPNALWLPIHILWPHP